MHLLCISSLLYVTISRHALFQFLSSIIPQLFLIEVQILDEDIVSSRFARLPVFGMATRCRNVYAYTHTRTLNMFLNIHKVAIYRNVLLLQLCVKVCMLCVRCHDKLE